MSIFTTLKLYNPMSLSIKLDWRVITSADKNAIEFFLQQTFVEGLA